MSYKNSSFDKLEEHYKKARSYRNNKYSSFNQKNISKYNNVIDQINNQGYSTLKKAIKKETLENILNKFDACLDTGVSISAPRNFSRINKTDDTKYTELKRLNRHDLSEGCNSYRNIVDNVQMQDPLVNNKSIIELLLNDDFIFIASEYLGALPTISYVKLVRNFANNLHQFDT